MAISELQPMVNFKEQAGPLFQPVFELAIPVIQSWADLSDQALTAGADWFNRLTDILSIPGVQNSLSASVGVLAALLPRRANAAITFMLIETAVAATSCYSDNPELTTAASIALIATGLTRAIRGNNDYENPENRNNARPRN